MTDNQYKNPLVISKYTLIVNYATVLKYTTDLLSVHIR